MEGGDSSVGLESGLSSSAACNVKEMSPTRSGVPIPMAEEMCNGYHQYKL